MLVPFLFPGRVVPGFPLLLVCCQVGLPLVVLPDSLVSGFVLAAVDRLPVGSQLDAERWVGRRRNLLARTREEL